MDVPKLPEVLPLDHHETLWRAVLVDRLNPLNGRYEAAHHQWIGLADVVLWLAGHPDLNHVHRLDERVQAVPRLLLDLVRERDGEPADCLQDVPDRPHCAALAEEGRQVSFAVGPGISFGHTVFPTDQLRQLHADRRLIDDDGHRSVPDGCGMGRRSKRGEPRGQIARDGAGHRGGGFVDRKRRGCLLHRGDLRLLAADGGKFGGEARQEGTHFASRVAGEKIVPELLPGGGDVALKLRGAHLQFGEPSADVSAHGRTARSSA